MTMASWAAPEAPSDPCRHFLHPMPTDGINLDRPNAIVLVRPNMNLPPILHASGDPPTVRLGDDAVFRLLFRANVIPLEGLLFKLVGTIPGL